VDDRARPRRRLTACDTALLNRFFTSWVTSHGQTGLNTRQRNLRHLFTWLEEAYGHPHPYTAALHRYAPLKKRPSTLAQEFIADLLEITGGGRARSFQDARDHAMIRMLTEGVRRMELIQLELPDLSADLIARPFVRVVPLKSARAFTEGRIVPLTPATSRSVVAYLRIRRSHRLAASSPALSPALWLGTRNRSPLTGSGLYRMLKRRAGQLATLSGHSGKINSLAVSHNAKWLASCSSDRTIRIWDICTWQVKALMRVDSNITACVWVGSDALAIGGEVGLYRFQFHSGTVLPS
jgi:site-specific recombinase XerD